MFKVNPFTSKFDEVGATDLDQIPIGDADTYFKWVAPDTLQLWVNGALAHSWTVAVSTTEGQPMGLLLTLTYPA
jgi:hypothetical protein